MSTLHIRIPAALKKAAQRVIEANGMDVSSAVRLFFTHIALRATIPLKFVSAISGLPKELEDDLLEQLRKKDFRGPFKHAKVAIKALHEDPV